MKKRTQIKFRIINFFLIWRAQILLFFYKGKEPARPKIDLRSWNKLPSYSDLDNWRNGLYWTGGGNDPRKIGTYDPDPELYSDGRLRIREADNLPPGYLYRSVMKYSKHQFTDVVISIIVTLNDYFHCIFACWLKSFHDDVLETDTVEIFQNRFRKVFGRKLAKAIFTLHWGTDYVKDHHQYGEGLWLRMKPHRFTQVREKGMLKWYVNRLLVMITPDVHAGERMGLIIDYEPMQALPYTYAEIDYSDIDVRCRGEFYYEYHLACPMCGKKSIIPHLITVPPVAEHCYCGYEFKLDDYLDEWY